MKNLILTGTLLFCIGLTQGLAYQPTWQDLVFFIQKQYKHLNKATIDLEVEIFTEEDSTKYQQVVYWTPQLKAMKTFNVSKELVDFYYESNGLSVRFSKQSLPYNVPQMLPPYLRLVHPTQIHQNFETLQIKGREVSLFAHDTDGAFFKVGNDRNYVLIDPQTLLPAQLIYGVWQDHQIQTIKIQFSHLVQFSVRYPREVDYFYNDFLFQRVILKYISTKKTIPVEKLQKQAQELLETRQIDFNLDYTQ